MIHALDGDGGIFTAEQVEAAIRAARPLPAALAVVSVEQTTNMGGGRVWPLEQVAVRCCEARGCTGCARTWTARG